MKKTDFWKEYIQYYSEIGKIEFILSDLIGRGTFL